MLSAAAGSVMIKTEDFGVQEETADFFFSFSKKKRHWHWHSCFDLVATEF